MSNKISPHKSHIDEHFMQFYFHQHIQYFTNACVISQNMHFFIFYALFRKKIIHNFFLEFSHKKLITFSSREFSDFSSDPIKLSQRTEHHNRKLRFYCHNKFFQLTIFPSASQQAWKIFQ